MREHAAASESLELALHEQGGATLVLTSLELPEEGLKVVADDAVEPVAARLRCAFQFRVPVCPCVCPNRCFALCMTRSSMSFRAPPRRA